MYIVMVSAELAPVAKVGGLADVVFGLSRELEVRGHAVEIILPKYDCMWYDEIWGLHKIWQNLWVPWHGAGVSCSVWFGFVQGRKCYFIEPHSQDNFFLRGAFYGFQDDPLRFAFFCKAAMEFMLKGNKRPDIIHCHDWQTGLIPVLLYEIYARLGMDRQRVVYTIHNFKHQGITGEAVLWATGLCRPEYYFHYDRLLDNFNHTAINLMKGGIVYSNYANTVSPHHSWEARFTEQGDGLGQTLAIHHYKFGGILNGVDYDVWNPETDRFIPSHYNVWNVEGKYANKDALRERLWLRKEYKPIVAYVGRLDAQKGVHLIQHSMFYSLERGAQFVMLGAGGDRGINNHFWHLKHCMNDNADCHMEIGFNEQLAHLIYAGADIIVVPSLFEPCGLAQMIAMRYGAVPVVRAVGGLVDTVFDRDHSDKPPEARNGYIFRDADFRGIESAISRAVGLWYDFPKEFRRLVTNAMASDYSWAQSGEHYLAVYEFDPLQVVAGEAVMSLRLVASSDDRALAIRDHLLPLIRERGRLEPQQGPVRLIAWEMDPWAFDHWTPFNDPVPEEAASPGYRHALERQQAGPGLGYGLDVWHGDKVLSVLWGDDGAYQVVSFVRGRWEDEALAL